VGYGDLVGEGKTFCSVNLGGGGGAVEMFNLDEDMNNEDMHKHRIKANRSKHFWNTL
jgi:hypothetical protein